MEEYKIKVKKRFTFLSMVCCASLPIYFILCYLTKNETPFAQGLIIGVLSSIEICTVIGLVKAFKLMHNDELLKKMYIEENDERNKAIQQKTGCKGLLITTFSTGIAAIIAGFFDIKICLALTAVLLFNMFVTLALRVYYSKTL